MKTKRNLLPILALFVITLSSFITKEKKTSVDYNNFYIYLYFHDKNDDKVIYISEAMHYEGYDNCGKSYDWKAKAEKAFRAYVVANYNNVNPHYTYMIGSTTGYYLSSKQEASEALNEWILEEKGKGNSISKTLFNFYCN
jgi:hypothetical protein